MVGGAVCGERRFASCNFNNRGYREFKLQITATFLIDGHVSGLGKIKHREFAMASGEMNADAIKDVSGRGDIVLDLFGGSGSTLIAAEKTGRRGYLCELDPIYCDRIIRRWEAFAKDDAEQIICGVAAHPNKVAA